MATQLIDCQHEIRSFHQNALKFREEFERFRGDLAYFNGAKHAMEPRLDTPTFTVDLFHAKQEQLQLEIKNLIDSFEQEEKARMTVDEMLVAAILPLQVVTLEAELGCQKTIIAKLPSARRVDAVDSSLQGPAKKIDTASQGLQVTLDIDERINKLDSQMQERLWCELGLKEDIKDVVNRFEQEERAHVARIKEFDQFHILQQSRFDDLAAKVETLEVLASVLQQERVSREHQNSHVELGLQEEIKSVVNRLEQEEKAHVARFKEFDQQQILQQSGFDDLAAKIETLEVLTSVLQQERDNREHRDCHPELQQLTQHLQDFHVLKHQVQELQNNQKGHLEGNAGFTHLQRLLDDSMLEQLSQLDMSFNAAMDSHYTSTNKMVEMKETLLQEMNDVKRELEKCAIQTTECQSGLQELKTQADAKKSKHRVQFKAEAKLVKKENLRPQQLVVKARTKSVAGPPVKVQQNAGFKPTAGSAQIVVALPVSPRTGASTQSVVATSPSLRPRAVKSGAATLPMTTSCLPTPKPIMHPPLYIPGSLATSKSAPLLPVLAKSLSVSIPPSTVQAGVQKSFDNHPKQKNCAAAVATVHAQ